MTDTPEVHGTPSPHAGGVKGFLHNDTAGMPNWVWLLVIAGGIGLAIAIKHFSAAKTGNATTTGTTPDSGLGLAVDPTTGLPYAVEGLVPAGGTVGQQQPPYPPPGPPTPTTKMALIRARDPKAPYDKQVAGGIPIRSSPGATTQTGLVPYGSTIAILSGPVTGTGNFGSTGNTQWYKVAGGYISAFDIASFSGSGGQQWPSNNKVIPMWPGGTMQQRIS